VFKPTEKLSRDICAFSCAASFATSTKFDSKGDEIQVILSQNGGKRNFTTINVVYQKTNRSKQVF
jgi:hypothetical protein